MINPINCNYSYENECGAFFASNMYGEESYQIPEKQWWMALKKSQTGIDLLSQCVRIGKVNIKPLAKEYRYIHNRHSVMNYGRLLLLLQECYNASPVLETYEILLDQITEYVRPATANDVQVEPDEIVETDRIKFNRLAKKWKKDTQFTSTMIKIAMHPSYQQIIGMGKAAISLILERLSVEPDHWFWALKAITEDDPVPEEYRGNLKKMTTSWLEWGRNHGYRV